MYKRFFKQLTFLLLLLHISHISQTQNLYDIKNPGNKYEKKCKRCITLLDSKPNEVQFGFHTDENNNIYFVVNDINWFNQFFKKSGDGIAIDVVSKDMYDCNIEGSIKNGFPYRGKLLEPMYLKDLKKNMQVNELGHVVIKVGKIPRAMINKDFECNLIILNNRYYCYYNNFYDIKSYRWDLLDMGLYMDTLSYASQFDTLMIKKEGFIYKDKTMQFIIPFEKNKHEYKPEDVKPVYDSLNLTDYNITRLTIRAYSSVEGSEARNIELQEKRAQSIIDILQAYQKPTIITDVKASENWVEFLNDINNTQYAYLAGLSKEEIKAKLEQKDISAQLEPYLSRHRKAILTVELQKKDSYVHLEPGELIKVFSDAIDEGKAIQAMDIQNAIFQKVIANEIPSNVIDKLTVPEKQEYSLLLVSRTAFKYFLNETDANQTYLEFERLEDLFPQDGHIKYNLCALKFRLWLAGDQVVEPAQFESEIRRLNSYKIPYKLVQRMLVNYNIVMSEYYMVQNDYAGKDRCLNFINQNYRALSLTDADLLSLAQYFSSYAHYDWAEKMLGPKMREINVDEDLLFYYLNLTLIDKNLVKTSSYRTIMLNAINANRERFCQLFDPFGKGGITFQLLENEYLKKTYCESCNQ